MPVSILYLWWLELPPDIAKSILWDKVASGWQHRCVRRLVSPSARSEQQIPGVGCSMCLLAWTTEQLQGTPGPPLAVGIHSSSEHLKWRHAHICLLVHADHTLLFRKSLLLEVTTSGRRMEKALRIETQIPPHQRLRDGWSCSKKTNTVWMGATFVIKMLGSFDCHVLGVLGLNRVLSYAFHFQNQFGNKS